MVKQMIERMINKRGGHLSPRALAGCPCSCLTRRFAYAPRSVTSQSASSACTFGGSIRAPCLPADNRRGSLSRACSALSANLLAIPVFRARNPVIVQQTNKPVFRVSKQKIRARENPIPPADRLAAFCEFSAVRRRAIAYALGQGFVPRTRLCTFHSGIVKSRAYRVPFFSMGHFVACDSSCGVSKR